MVLGTRKTLSPIDMNWRFPKYLCRLAVLVIANVCLTSCIIFPNDPPETIESTITGDQLSLIKAGRSTKDQVLEQFGPPLWSSTDGSQWKYEIRRYRSWGWLICSEDPYDFGWGSGCDSLERNVKVEILDIDFDNAGIVEKWKTHDEALTKCIISGDCSFLAYENRNLKPSNVWFEDASPLRLVDRDGLLYEAGASSPFTGTRSSYYEDGTKAGECQFEMGLRHGVCKLWHDDGSIYKNVTYEVGVLNGLLTKWYRNGLKYSVAHYEDGLRNGVMTIWDDSGNVIANDCYRDGYLVTESPEACD